MDYSEYIESINKLITTFNTAVEQYGSDNLVSSMRLYFFDKINYYNYAKDAHAQGTIKIVKQLLDGETAQQIIDAFITCEEEEKRTGGSPEHILDVLISWLDKDKMSYATERIQKVYDTFYAAVDKFGWNEVSNAISHHFCDVDCYPAQGILKIADELGYGISVEDLTRIFVGRATYIEDSEGSPEHIEDVLKEWMTNGKLTPDPWWAETVVIEMYNQKELATKVGEVA